MEKSRRGDLLKKIWKNYQEISHGDRWRSLEGISGGILEITQGVSDGLRSLRSGGAFILPPLQAVRFTHTFGGGRMTILENLSWGEDIRDQIDRRKFIWTSTRSEELIPPCYDQSLKQGKTSSVFRAEKANLWISHNKGE